MADGQVVFEITADKKPIGQALNDTTKMIQQESGKWDQAAQGSTEKIGNNFASMFTKISAAAAAAKVGQVLLSWGKDAIAAASDLQEVQNVVDVTFGSGSAQIDSWAKTAQTQFGLTETQAKKFTSTLGAMMKSAGLAGPEIVTMSEDLSELAADMASFYNLDFDTAFQKIRSGISGETEPLKQLGINMSVANLEAYALSKGITKAFNDMSQGEQTMIRYQYLMQATADAQGDFARTSDGYANSMRRMETAMESIKTTIGTLFLPAIETAVSGLANFLGSITQPKPRTVLDEFADIDLKTDAKLLEIQNTADQAQLLKQALEEIAGSVTNSAETTGLVSFINSFSGSVSGLDKALTIAKLGDVNGSIESLAGALSTNLTGDPDKWKNLLVAIKDNAADAIAAARGDYGATQRFLEGVAAGADDLTTDYSVYWANLLKALGENAGSAISALAGGYGAGTILSGIANGSNALDSGSPALWTSLLTTLQKVNGLSNIFSGSGAKNVEDLAKALSNNSPDSDRAAAWQTFLDALGTNSDALSKLTGTSADQTAEWLKKMKEAANGLEPTDAEAWNKLLGNFVTGLPGLSNTEAGKEFFETMAKNFLAMGAESEEAKAGLAALGLSTEQISEKQQLWLAVCKQLVSTIPGLSSIIDTQTGEVKGGTAAIEEYIKSWNDLMSRDIMMEAVRQKKEALAAEFSNLPELAAYAAPYAVKLKEARKKFEDALGGRTYNPYGNAEDQANLDALYKSYAEATAAFNKAYAPYKERKDAYDQALSLLTDQEQAMKELGYTAEGTAESVDDTAKSMTLLEQAANGTEGAMDQVKAALENAQTAFKNLADYQEKVREETDRTVKGVIKGFDSIITPAQKTKAEMKDLKDSLVNAKTPEEIAKINKEINKLGGSAPSAQNMLKGLQSQLDYMREYKAALDNAKRMGASDELLASLSDGSQESFDYLKALADGSASIADLNEKYRQVQEEAASFTNELTNQKLTVDSTYQSLVKTAQDAVSQLNMSGAAGKSVAATMDAIVKTLGDKKAEVATQVTGILNELARLTASSSYGTKVGRTVYFTPHATSVGSHANGLDNVPYDGYFALLHQGERVQTAAEADLSRRYGNQAPGVDYGAMGGAIRAGMGNMKIIWHGRVVADVLSEQQGDSYRALERSGWQS